MNGFRVRVRVVQEYDVALWAESEADAEARAEALVRDGGEADGLEDSWPEEVIAVEAVAVEPYPEIE